MASPHYKGFWVFGEILFIVLRLEFCNKNVKSCAFLCRTISRIETLSKEMGFLRALGSRTFIEIIVEDLLTSVICDRL